MSRTSSAFNLKLRHIIKTSLAYTAYISGMIDSLASYRTGIRSERRIIMLGYHRIVEDFSHSSRRAIPSLLTSTRTLRRQLDLILRKYDCISIDDMLAALTGKLTLRRDAVVLTFDDGYRDFYQLVFPILRAYG